MSDENNFQHFPIIPSRLWVEHEDVNGQYVNAHPLHEHLWACKFWNCLKKWEWKHELVRAVTHHSRIYQLRKQKNTTCHIFISIQIGIQLREVLQTCFAFVHNEQHTRFGFEENNSVFEKQSCLWTQATKPAIFTKSVFTLYSATAMDPYSSSTERQEDSVWE